MEVYNPQLLPQEIIRLADYYGVKRLIALRRDPRQGERKRRGVMGEEEGGVITLFLDRIFHRGTRRILFAVKAGVWLQLLETLLHEVGHARQTEWPEEEYRRSEWQWGYWGCYPERDARCFAYREILRLADLDDDLFMPHHFRDWGYLGVRLSRLLSQQAENVRQAPNFSVFPVEELLSIWAARLNAGSHVPHDHPMAPFCTRVHRTRDGRRWRFLTVAQTARQQVFNVHYGALLWLRSGETAPSPSAARGG